MKYRKTNVRNKNEINRRDKVEFSYTKTSVRNILYNVRDCSDGKGIKHLLNNLVTITNPKITHVKSMTKIRPIYDKYTPKILKIPISA